MAYTNFKADVWALAIERERDRNCVGWSLSNNDHEGEVAEYGKSVKINWTKRPTVSSYTGAAITTAETLDATNSSIAIDQAKYVNFLVDDVDELQAKPKIMASCMKEAAAAIAEDADDYIYSLYTACGASVVNATCTSTTIIETLSSAVQKMRENKVPSNVALSLEVTPAIYQKMWIAKITQQLPNEMPLENGLVAMWNGLKVYQTVGVKVVSTVHMCLLRTKAAISVIGQMQKMEAYRPQNLFADAVKGLHVYGAAVVRPLELITLKLTPVAG